MKKFLKVKYILIALGVIAIIGSGVYIYVNKSKNDDLINPDNKSKNQESSENSPATEKTDAPQIEQVKNPDEGKPTPSVSNNLGVLGDVFLTAYYNSSATTSMDGKTVVPSGSIQPYLFPQGSGVYSVQKMSNGSWIDVASNVSYSGHGGIVAAYAGPKEDNIQYRVIKIESGKPVSVSKTFVIIRDDLVGVGVKTYN